jgi:hypothetical protein
MMKPIEVTASKNKVMITIDKAVVSPEDISLLLKQLQMKILSKKPNFDEEMHDFSEKLKNHWWEENKDQFLQT